MTVGSVSVSAIQVSFWSSGNRLLITDRGRDRAYTFTVSTLFSGTGNQPANMENALFSGNPANGDATGIALVNSTALLKPEITVAGERVMLLTVKAYPNPAQGLVTVQIKGPCRAPGKLDILDGAGKSVKTVPLGGINATTQYLPLNVSGLPQGRYLLVCTRGGLRCMEEMVVQ